ncbi:MAG TPA: (2Fe-2S)-binding protein [Gemmatimonas sp.]|uniref:(2Fe-2S)-binding protein n=1 Tax=Gemmatimonas sp. TaxID=1962908 RepID=UPI002ED89BF0
MSQSEPVRLLVNGREQVVAMHPDTPLLWALRESLQLMGTRFGCGMAQCGACLVHVDGVPTPACVTSIGTLTGRVITTIEGVQGPVVDAVRDAWVKADLSQCGYCQSGQVMATIALLGAQPMPTDADIDRALERNVCRCGTYPRIRAAIHAAAQQLAAASTSATTTPVPSSPTSSSPTPSPSTSPSS